MPRLGLAPVDAGLAVARLVGHEQLDRRPERGVGEAARGLERLERLAEVGGEEVVDHVEHLGPRAVVLRQREHAADLLAALPEDLDVRMAEAVDRLELVADEEDLGVLVREQVDELALEPVRVLELVDHDRAEAPALALADLGVLAQQLAREQLQVLEVERRLAVLGLPVGAVVGEQQLLQLLAIAGGELLQRGLLDRGARLLELGRAAKSERSSSPSGPGAESRKRSAAAPACAPRRAAPRAAPRAVAARSLDPQREPGRAQRLMDTGQHPPQPPSAVRGEQAQAASSSPQNSSSAARKASPRSTRPWLSSTTRKRGSIPAANGCAFSSRWQKPWMVEIQAASRSRARSWRPSSCSRRGSGRAARRRRARCR